MMRSEPALSRTLMHCNCSFFIASGSDAIQLGAAREAGWLRREGLLAMTWPRLLVFPGEETKRTLASVARMREATSGSSPVPVANSIRKKAEINHS
jgi:hypothetical protein